MPDATQRILLLAPLAADGRALGRVLRRQGIEVRVIGDPRDLAGSLGEAPRLLAVLVTHEGATDGAGDALAAVIAREPSWSRLPLIFLVDGQGRLPPAVRRLHEDARGASLVVLPRPVTEQALGAVVAAHVESRRRQFETRDLLQRLEQAERRSAFLLSETRHRTRNSLAVLQSLFTLTASRSGGRDELVEAFGARLRALARAHLALAKEEAEVRLLGQLVEEHVHPYCLSPDQVRLAGPPLRLRATVVLNLSLVLHELATNAAKYGALSAEAGRLDISWRAAEGGYRLLWSERGGPPVTPPKTRGLGSKVVESLMGEKCEIDYRPTGLLWSALIPAEDVEPEDVEPEDVEFPGG